MQNSSAINQIELKYQLLASVLDERSPRQWAATEARAYGWGAPPVGVFYKRLHVGIEHTALVTE
jgi:hypothetical protein